MWFVGGLGGGPMVAVGGLCGGPMVVAGVLGGGSIVAVGGLGDDSMDEGQWGGVAIGGFGLCLG